MFFFLREQWSYLIAFVSLFFFCFENNGFRDRRIALFINTMVLYWFFCFLLVFFAPNLDCRDFCLEYTFLYKNNLKGRGKPVQHFIQHHSPMLDEMLDEKLNVGWSKIFGLWGFFHPTIKRLKIFIVPFILSEKKAD